MCVKNIFYNTYADGAQDVTEEVYPCREGRASHVPEVHKYSRKLPFGKGTHFLGDLPTPRSSKSPSPNRRSTTTYAPVPGLADVPKSTKHHSHHDRHGHHRRRSSRHFDTERDIPSDAILTRSMTSPHVPHYVVIDQDQSRFKHLDIPMGPVHVIDGHGGHRRKSSKDSRDHEPSGLQRRHSVNQQSYVVVNDNREHRRRERRERRMSTSDAIPVPPAAPTAPDIHPGSPRRLGRRAATVVHSSGSSNATSSSDSPPPKHVRWDEKMRLARERHNAEIAKREAPADNSQGAPLKSILKNTATTVEPPKTKHKDRDSSAEARERRRARRVKREEEEELDLFDHDRLRARFGSDEEGDRDRRRRSKVWLAGDRYQYL